MMMFLSIIAILFGCRLEPLAAQELQKVRISYSSRSNSTTVYQVALAKGFFKEEGLEPEMIQMNPRLGGLAVHQKSARLVELGRGRLSCA